jgi:hypothetical protein
MQIAVHMRVNEFCNWSVNESVITYYNLLCSRDGTETGDYTRRAAQGRTDGIDPLLVAARGVNV